MNTLKYTYDEYVETLKELFVIQGENSDWFLMPDYKHIMKEYDMWLDKCEEEISIEDLTEILNLEVKRLNSLQRKDINEVILWIKEVITAKEILSESKEYGLEKDLLEMLEYYKKEKKEAETN